jgi:branched-chain amino acid transport system substrate-binding protein
MTNKRIMAIGVGLFLALGGNPVAAAERHYDPGVSDTEIRIGQTLPLSGPLSSFASFAKAEAAYFAKINAEGGVNGRKIKLISLDDGYSPPKTVEQTRKLVEEDQVFLLFSSLGTVTNAAILRYVNDHKIPQLFIISGAEMWADPRPHPWSMGWPLTYRAEAKIYAQYLLRHQPAAKIALLYQQDDFGKEYLEGLEEGLGDRAGKMIVARASYLPTDPTVDSQIVTLQGSGADTLMLFAVGKSAAQALRKVDELGWSPNRFLSYTSATVALLKSVGFDRSSGIISAGFAKDPSDPQWRDDPAMRAWRAWMRDYDPGGDTTDIVNVYGYSLAQTLVQVLRQCGDRLTRDNVMRQAANLRDVALPMLRPGIKLNTSATNFIPIREAQLMRFDGTQWAQFDGLLH